jgi:adenine-specific DNA-methyltransferase
MDLIFGENNFISLITVISNPRGRQSTSNVAPTHEYLLIYSKTNHGQLWGEPISDEKKKEYRYKDEKGFYRELGLRLRGGRQQLSNLRHCIFQIYVNPKNAAIIRE